MKKIKKPCAHRLAISLYTFSTEKWTLPPSIMFLTLHATTTQISASKLVYILQFLVVYMTAKPTFVKTATQTTQCNLREMIHACFSLFEPSAPCVTWNFFDLSGIKACFISITIDIKMNITNCKWVFVPMHWWAAALSARLVSNCFTWNGNGFFLCKPPLLECYLPLFFPLCHWSLTVPQFFAVVCCTKTLKAEQRQKWAEKKITVINILVHLDTAMLIWLRWSEVSDSALF